ncbi:MAG: stage V sporulation protein AD [Clostridia bacterium]|nr:stage V sporulation protein AD [Clostridia bacterium]
MRNELLELDARILAAASVVGKKEREGPLGEKFDLCDPDGRFGRKTWEGAESEMQRLAFNTVLAKAGMRDTDVGALFAGDLLNQCVGSAYGLLDFDVPYFGLYGACSTCAEGLLLASAMVSSGLLDCCGTVTSSHYCSAERQYRTPIEYGSQRPPTAQWTATAAGAFLVQKNQRSATPRAVIRRGLPGKVIEKGVNDANNMGAAMAPAALDTLLRFFSATGTRPLDYGRIFTGDLGHEGGKLLCELMALEDYADFADVYDDCGRMIYFKTEQDVHSGGSGCGCSAAVLAAEILPSLLRRNGPSRVLFLSTGAMMSPDSIKQGQNIPAVAHLLEIVAE